MRTLLGVLFMPLVLVGCASPAVTVAPTAAARDAGPTMEEPPVWKKGDRWVYTQRVGFAESRLTREVVEAGPGGYVVRAEGKAKYAFVRWGLYNPDLSLTAWIEDEKITYMSSPALQLFRWPLRAGLTWLAPTGNAGES